MRNAVLRATFKLIQDFWEVTPALSGASRPTLSLSLSLAPAPALALALALRSFRNTGEYPLAKRFDKLEDHIFSERPFIAYVYEFR